MRKLEYLWDRMRNYIKPKVVISKYNGCFETTIIVFFKSFCKSVVLIAEEIKIDYYLIVRNFLENILS